VPALGLPNMMTVRGRMSSPAFFGGTIDPAKNDPASSACALIAASKLSIVSSTECLLGFVTSPSSADPATEGIASAIAATNQIFVILLFSHAAGSEKISHQRGNTPPPSVMFVNHCGEMSTSPASK
jgi:hypothetical protein